MSSRPSRLRLFLRFMLYAFLAIFAVLVLLAQCNWMPMRTPDTEWLAKLQAAGQSLTPVFLNVASPTDRTIHAVSVASSDTLPLVVCVHGSPGAADAYLTYLADTTLTRQARLVAIDRPGFGYTSGFGQPESSLAAQSKAVQAIVKQLSPHRKVILVGHSMGGPVICRFAMDYPEMVAGLVIVAGSIDPTQEEHPWWQTAVNIPPVSWITPKPLWTSNAEIIPLEQELTAMLPMWPRIMCPVRVLHATDDRLVPVENAEFARRMLTNSSDLKVDILPDGNHFILWNHHAVVQDAVLDLLKNKENL